MPYDPYTAERVAAYLDTRRVHYRVLRMMGGWCAMVNEKMCLGVLTDKESGQPILMARIGDEASASVAGEPDVRTSIRSVGPMRGYVFVEAAGFDHERDLERWVDRCLAYNPQAKSSKGKSPRRP